MGKHGSTDMVYVENEWYDGPRAGVADINGVPHRFKLLFDEEADQYLGTFLVWPIGQRVLDQETEQWRIFVEWNASYEAGEATTESHPAYGGLSARWDELEVLLRRSRTEVPSSAKRANAELHRIDRESRYAASGPAYTLTWHLL
jgi:hypothetical protein